MKHTLTLHTFLQLHYCIIGQVEEQNHMIHWMKIYILILFSNSLPSHKMNIKMLRVTARAIILLLLILWNLDLQARPLTSVEFTTVLVLLLTFLLKTETNDVSLIVIIKLFITTNHQISSRKFDTFYNLIFNISFVKILVHPFEQLLKHSNIP